MEWIIYAFFGVMGILVAGIIGLGLYQAFWGKGAGEANQGPNMGASRAGDADNLRSGFND